MAPIDLPADVVYVRTTPTFTEETVPAGLLGQHRVAKDTWAVLTVHTGSLDFVFDEQPDTSAADPQRRRIDVGETQVIPPRRLHHLEVDGPVTFDVAFYA